MRRGVACVFVGTVVLGVAPSAQAAFHEMKIREVFPSVGTDDFIELQMFSAGQNSTGGHEVTVYDSAGAVTNTIPLVSVPNGQNQRTILIGAAPTVLGETPDVVNGALNPDPAGGAVCFADAVPKDCVTWGNFPEPVGFPNPQTADAAPVGISAGSSLDRSIAAGNPALLEPGDDTDNSSTDFSLDSTPTPCPNTRTQTATDCTGDATDSDGDGIPNTLDACQNFPASTPNGCPTPTDGDGDGDGVPDATDQCPATAALGANGCPPGVDNRDPTQQVNGAKKQDVDKLSLRVSADEGATLVGTGTVKVPGPRRLWKFKTVTKTVTGGQSVKLRFKLAPKALEQVKNALEDGIQKARLKVTATDAAGNASEERRTINLTD